jgi:hypothetical protein
MRLFNEVERSIVRAAQTDAQDAQKHCATDELRTERRPDQTSDRRPSGGSWD